MTYSQVWWPILGIRALHLPIQVHTNSSEHKHTVNTHPEQWSAIYAAAPGEQLGVRCLAQGHLPCHVTEGGESAVHSLPHWQSLPDRDSNSQPFDYESDSLTLGHDFPQPSPFILIKITSYGVHLRVQSKPEQSNYISKGIKCSPAISIIKDILACNILWRYCTFEIFISS